MPYAVDHRNDRIVKMTPDGTWLAVWGSSIPVLDGGFVPHPEGIAVDTHGNVYLNDRRAVEISPEGRVVQVLSLDFGPNGIEFVAVAPGGSPAGSHDPGRTRRERS